ncbi:DUF349 domain-containing protein [Thalassotalea maritima]|uniref:DUF349 domain-containing protein n=1 Tax=Thalassotalea maritima TaxID=3242416 RepID=UPI00352955AE
MIFKNLFKAKWQHQDANIRIRAIKEFDLNNADNKAIIDSMIHSDSSDLVRRCGLLTLASAERYLYHLTHNSSSKIRAFCDQQLQKHILDNTLITKQEKHDYLLHHAKTAFIEQWLHLEKDSELLATLLDKVQKPNQLRQFVVHSDNQTLRLQALQRVVEQSQLEKIAKKLTDGSVKDEVDRRLKAMYQASEKPQLIAKQVQLILAKLNALKEQFDYPALVTKQQNLMQQWQKLEAEFDYLSDNDKQSYHKKYVTIMKSVGRHMAPLQESYEHQRAIERLNEQKQQQYDDIKQRLHAISQQIGAAIAEQTSFKGSAVERNLDSIRAELDASQIEDTDRRTLLATIRDLENKLTRLPKITDAIVLATSLVTKLSTVTVPNSMSEWNEQQPLYDEWTKKWQHIDNTVAGLLPDPIDKARQEIDTQWQQAVRPLQSEQTNLYQHVRKKIAELKRLIASGKYKSAFGLHKKISFQMQDLSETQKRYLANDFNDVTKKINELHELEHFVVTPRKQMLLDEIQLLADTPLADPKQQAQKVKEYRQHWNKLGRADDALEDTLNDAFNDACERAFAPCRAYFAEQEQLRQQHLAQKQQVLEKLRALEQQLSVGDVEVKHLENQLSKLKQEWRQTGEVERSVYHKLQKQYQQSVAPLVKHIEQYHLTNKEAKQALIEQAKAQLENDNLHAAIEELKQLQVKWKSLGFAGQKFDNQLWKSFRKVNDAVFAKREEQKQQQKQVTLEAVTKLEQTFVDLVQNADTEAVNGIEQYIADLSTFIDHVVSQKPVAKTVLTRAEQARVKAKKALYEKQQAQRSERYHKLFDVVEQLSLGHDIALENTAIPSAWQKLLKEGQRQPSKDRGELTLMLEITANAESPAEFQTQRMQVQVHMLSESLMQASNNIDELLKRWLAHGAFTKRDIGYVSRVKKLFIK